MNRLFSAPLKALLQAFEVNEEAKSFIITPPPMAGSAFEFNEPYFHAHNLAMTDRQMSEELHILVTALAAGLTTHLAYYTQLKHLSKTVGRDWGTAIFMEEDRRSLGIVLGNQLYYLDNSGGVVARRASGGNLLGGYIGIKTELGIFPVTAVETLVAEARKIAIYQANPEQRPWRASPRSVYHPAAVPTFGGFMPTEPIPIPQPGWYEQAHALAPGWDRKDGGGANADFNFSGWGPASQGATPVWENRTTLFDAPDEDPVGSSVLATLFQQACATQYGEPSNIPDEVLNAYPARRASSFGINYAVLRANLRKELMCSTMSWKVFTKGLDVLGFRRGVLYLNAVSKSGEDVKVQMNISNWDCQDTQGALRFLFNEVLSKWEIDEVKLPEVIRAYIHDAEDPAANQEVLFSNLSRELNRSSFTWPVFLRGLAVLGIAHVDFDVEAIYPPHLNEPAQVLHAAFNVEEQL